jgi:peptidyl-prolyl cis-trans isomerase SurA
MRAGVDVFMKKFRHSSSLVAVLALSLLGAVAQAQVKSEPTPVAPGLAPVDRIVAVVDEDVILRSELDRALVNVKKQYAAHPEQLPPASSLEKQVLERLILMRLQLARANDTGLKISDAELDQAVQRVAEKNHATLEQLQQQLAAQGMSYQQFRSELRDELTVQTLQQKLVESRVTVSEAEIDNQIAMQHAGGPQVHLAHILVAMPEAATPEQVKLAQTKIDGIKDLIDKGQMEFSTAAIRFSDSPNALEGGDLGWRSLDEVPPAFTEIIKQLKPNEVTQPIRGVSGFQILKVLETRTAGQAIAQKVTEYHAQDIMVSTKVLTSEQAKAKIDQIRARVAAGEDFATIAKKESENDTTRDKGGDMGWFQASRWGSAVGTQMEALKDGELSQPFQSEVGWHLIQRLGSRETTASDESQRDAARQAIAQRKSADEYERFLRQLRSEAYVDVRLGDQS